MKIKEIRLYDIDVYKNEELIYSGMAESAPEEIKMSDAKNISITHKRIKIDI